MVDNRRTRSLRLSCKLIMKKAEMVYHDITQESNATTEDLKRREDVCVDS